MLALLAQLGDRLPQCISARRAVRPGPRRLAGTELVLRDPDGRPVGRVTSPDGRLRLGPHAPTMYLRRGPDNRVGEPVQG